MISKQGSLCLASSAIIALKRRSYCSRSTAGIVLASWKLLFQSIEAIVLRLGAIVLDDPII